MRIQGFTLGGIGCYIKILSVEMDGLLPKVSFTFPIPEDYGT